MSLSAWLARSRPVAETLWQPLDHEPACVLFFSLSDGKTRATVQIATGADFEQAWLKGASALQRQASRQRQPLRGLRIDLVASLECMAWQALQQRLQTFKRNYFPYGIAFDAGFKRALLEEELGANAILYHGEQEQATANPQNLANYTQRRFGKALSFPAQADAPVWCFTTRSLFCDGKDCHVLSSQGANRGYRQLPQWGEQQVAEVVGQANAYLARQVRDSGRYHYGWFPCFDRAIPTYNALRHASSTYALLEGWEMTAERDQWQAIERALDYLVEHLIKPMVLPDGQQAAFLVDLGDEIKLGGNAVCVLALAKFTELSGERHYLPLMEQLALGILFMQEASDGSFVHVLNYPDLSLKERQRIIYYDGEAAFGLMRLYGLTHDPRWIAAVERAFEHFIAARHWQAHDHWLSYCVNELTLYRPEARYYQFGLDNVRDHLEFVLNRITTYPTLLELMMAAQRMIQRLQSDPVHRGLLLGFDLPRFERALAFRARYLLNGFFWPELAMFFKNPARIAGSFFIRHHSFRVRIDDVEHYVSGYVAYWKYLKARCEAAAQITPPADTPVMEACYFCNQDFGATLTGVERSSLKRANLFVEHLGLVPRMLTLKFNLQARRHWQHYQALGWVDPQVGLTNLYDELLQVGEGQSLPAATVQLEAGWRLDDVPDTCPLHQRGYDANGRLRLYVVWQDSAEPRLDYINHFHQGRKFQRDKFNVFGQLAVVQQLDGQGRVLREDCFTPRGQRRLLRAWDAEKARLDLIQWFTDTGAVRHFASEEGLAGAWLSEYVTQSGNLFIIDKHRAWAKPLQQLQQLRPQRLVSALHSIHIGEPYQDLQQGRLNSNYRAVLNGEVAVESCVVLTEAQQRDVQQRFATASYQVRCIPHAQAIPETEPDPGLRDPDRLVALVRLAPEKRIEDMLRIMQLLVNELPDKQLHIYGSGSEQARLQALIDAWGLQDNVFLRGYVERVDEVFAHASLSLLTSRVEGFAMSVAESLSHGCPVLAYDIHYGPSSMIEHGRNGWLVADGDVAAAARLLVDIFREPGRLEQASRQAYQQAQAYRPQAIAEHWQALLQAPVHVG